MTSIWRQRVCSRTATRSQPIVQLLAGERVDVNSQSLVQRALTMIAPPHCLICLQAADQTRGVCAECQSFLIRPDQYCKRCAMVLPVSSICGRCQRRSPAFDSVVPAFLYRPPLTKRIRDIKFASRFDYLEAAGFALTREIQQRGLHADLLVPVPLHRQRLRQRGFDQTLEIARIVSRELRIPLNQHSLRRLKPTLAQTTISPADRARNMRGAFQCQRSLISQMAAKRVVLIDDVLTTGATCHEAALSLKRAGAGNVSVWVLARA